MRAALWHTHKSWHIHGHKHSNQFSHPHKTYSVPSDILHTNIQAGLPICVCVSLSSLLGRWALCHPVGAETLRWDEWGVFCAAAGGQSRLRQLWVWFSLYDVQRGCLSVFSADVLWQHAGLAVFWVLAVILLELPEDFIQLHRAVCYVKAPTMLSLLITQWGWNKMCLILFVPQVSSIK